MCRVTANAVAVYRNKSSVFEYIYSGGMNFHTTDLVKVVSLFTMMPKHFTTA